MDEATKAALVEIFTPLPRQGPGDRALLERMIGMLGIPRGARIADFGCGTGQSARLLAAYLDAEVLALDNSESFITELKRRLVERPLRRGRVVAKVGDMAQSGVAPRALDLIVSEGAAYGVGFGEALSIWRPLVKEGGGLVVSECVWFGAERPAEAAEFWRQEYPTMGSIGEAVAKAEVAGWRLRAAERLASAAWWDDFYGPVSARLAALEQEAQGGSALAGVIAEIRREMAMMERFSDVCGYVYLALD